MNVIWIKKTGALFTALSNGRALRAYRSGKTYRASVNGTPLTKHFDSMAAAKAAAELAARPRGKRKAKGKASTVNYLSFRKEFVPSKPLSKLKKNGSLMERILPILTKAEGATFDELAAVFAAMDAERGRTSKRHVKLRMREAIIGFCNHLGYGTQSTATTIRLIGPGK